MKQLYITADNKQFENLREAKAHEEILNIDTSLVESFRTCETPSQFLLDNQDIILKALKLLNPPQPRKKKTETVEQSESVFE